MRYQSVCARMIAAVIMSVGLGDSLATAEDEAPSPLEVSLARYYYPQDVEQIEVVITGIKADHSNLRIEISKQPGSKVLASSTTRLLRERRSHRLQLTLQISKKAATWFQHM